MNFDELTDEADDARSRKIFDAYRRAHKRTSSGADRSESTFLEELKIGFGNADVFEDSEEREFWTSAWSEQVKPSRLGVWSLKYGVKGLAEVGEVVRDIVNPFPDWMKLPRRVRGVTWTNEVKTKKISVDVEIRPQDLRVIEDCLSLPPDEGGKFQTVKVWVDTRSSSVHLPLMVGDRQLGTVTPATGMEGYFWARKGLFGAVKVPDGTLRLRSDPANPRGVAVKKAKLRVMKP